jgi:hypothetical protein
MDCFTEGVCLSRRPTRSIYNAATEDWNQFAWACGKCESNPGDWYAITDPNPDNAADRWRSFMESCFRRSASDIPGKDTCLRTGDSAAEYQYWNIHWLSWTYGGLGGGFSYIRTGAGDGYGDACDNCPGFYNPGQDDDDLESTEFTNPSGSATADCIESTVCLTRAASGGPVINTQSGQIEWACGQCRGATAFIAQFANLKDACFGGDLGGNIVGSDTCLRIAGSGAKWDIRWLSYQGGGAGGGFSYRRSRGDGFGNACDGCWSVSDPQQTDENNSCDSFVMPYAQDPFCGDLCED